MPFKSKAQAEKLAMLESQGKVKKGTTKKLAAETPNMAKLPTRVIPKKSPASTDDLRATYKKKFGK